MIRWIIRDGEKILQHGEKILQQEKEKNNSGLEIVKYKVVIKWQDVIIEEE